MNYGFVKVAAAVPHVKVADCKFNVEKIESLIAVAEGKGVQIILFPEMSITGYTCGDLFSQQLLLEEACGSIDVKDIADEEEFRMIKDIVVAIVQDYNLLRKELKLDYNENEIKTGIPEL